MRLPRQATVRRAITFPGVGLHSGAPCVARLVPVRANFGVKFVRVGSKQALVDADFRNVQFTSPLCTELKSPDGNVARTVEHLMAALWSCGVSNCLIELEGGNEVPILDGSSLDFVEALRGNVLQQREGIPAIQVLRTVSVYDEEKDSEACISPWEEGEVTNPVLECKVSLDSYAKRLPFSTTQSHSHTFGCKVSEAKFVVNFAAARTFGFEKDVKLLESLGLAKGGSLKNAVVFKGDGSDDVLNPGGLRFEDEWARHKLLDCIGDLALCTSPFGVLHGKFSSHRPGHSTTNKLLRALFSEPSNFTVVKDTKAA